MYVCVCLAVTERQIHQAASAGAKTVKDLRRDLGLGSDCGRCTGCARQCLKDARSGPARDATAPTLATA
ncbi:MAG: (2Fe-2S)-binding protein [Azonexus sp.]|jgi:bacterioferritin-associated ferredoxin|nr:(2Fe-2S)-binding protein [Betaproteobacteria bacterium]MBK8917510.1 (2Fe-2S)-binding protein [Betaproteobacteria bacterium]MBP6036881.1 (2Fe-2S)-binding protein [Azonexus sp.]MBP6907416.1 (2Fe-2S)-binding protein [Azonexus sp.]